MNDRRSAGIPTECVGCGAQLDAHNITKLCRECKLIARNRRLTGLPADTANPVTYDEAIANITTIFGVVAWRAGLSGRACTDCQSGFQPSRPRPFMTTASEREKERRNDR